MFKLFSAFGTKEATSSMAPAAARAPLDQEARARPAAAAEHQAARVAQRKPAKPDTMKIVHKEHPPMAAADPGAVFRSARVRDSVRQQPGTQIPLSVLRKALPLRFAAMAQSSDEFCCTSGYNSANRKILFHDLRRILIPAEDPSYLSAILHKGPEAISPAPEDILYLIRSCLCESRPEARRGPGPLIPSEAAT